MSDKVTIEEIITPDIAAEIEHREWERGNENRERWAALEAKHMERYNRGLFTPREWGEHCAGYDSHLDWVGSVHADAYAQ
jgi:hypothetical protein